MKPSLGILTYNAPKTLEATLKTFFDNGFQNNFQEILVYVNPSDKLTETQKVLDEYADILCFIGDKNEWIGPGFRWMVEASKSPTILLSEDDFILTEEDKDKVSQIISSAHDLLMKGETDVARFRSRYNPGSPLYSSWLAGQEHRGMTHLSECVHWKENPDIDFPDFCKKISDTPVWYKFSSRNSNFTNNPCMYKVDFYKEHIIPSYCLPNTDIETAATNWWSQQDFSVLSGDGLFCHDRKDGK